MTRVLEGYGADLQNGDAFGPRRRSHAPLPLAAYALMAGADEADADLIAKAIEARLRPNYEERLSVFEVVGPWRPSREPFRKGNG
jgi:hypothetical protein